jgi:hypothetical protein
MQMLRSFFDSELWQLRALNCLFKAWGGGDDWLGREFIEPYAASWRAFDPLSSRDEALRDFGTIYNVLDYYFGVFRPQSPSDCWPPEKIFDTIKSEFVEFSWRGSVNLLNFAKGGAGARLESCLAKLQGIKPKRQYPLMLVSKFLHFYNPSLFPIYDNAMIWEKVLNGRFKEEYRQFCRREGMSDYVAFQADTAVWLRDYINFAGGLLSIAHSRFTQVFVEWLSQQRGVDLSSVKFDPATLYATAFEFTIIGATAAESAATA